ncbi:20261_t:CDS:1, partial [Cetraspora pellucida]
QYSSKHGQPRKQVDKTLLAAVLSNFRVAKNVVDYNLSDDKISNLHNVQSDSK